MLLKNRASGGLPVPTVAKLQPCAGRRSFSRALVYLFMRFAKKNVNQDFLNLIIFYLFAGQIEQQNPQSHYWPQYQYQVPQHQNHQDSHYWPQYQYQVPYNLTKGQFEVWQMEAMATGIDQMSYSSQHIVYQGKD